MKKGNWKICKNDNCDNLFYEYPYQKGKRMFCSTSCSNKDIGNRKKNSESKKGKKSYMWGKHPANFKKIKISSDGYRLVWNGKKHVREHRLVMEIWKGRKLRGKEVVHHIDGNKLNNNLSNLFLCKNESEHRKFHKKYAKK